MQIDFCRIAVVNRGEPAMRLIHAVRELNAEHDTDIQTVALYTDPDRGALFVRAADHAVCLGPAMVSAPDGGSRSAYLDLDRLREALLEARADAAWVGWGFVAERPEFVELCDEMEICFIGPSAEVMRLMGDKIASKQLAERSEVPVAAWSGGPVADDEQAEAEAERVGYPLLIKASAGGGGRGIRKVERPEQLAEALSRARAEAASAFGDDTVFLESLVQNARHVEVQLLGDSAGTVWAVGVRDCTLQRRNQKVVEEAPCPVMDADQQQALCDAAVNLARAAGYQNAGTAEFLFRPQSGDFFFMEMNTRLQVEHPVTEATTGLDLVKWQLFVAGGALLQGEPPATRGHAVEVRLNAEDADAGFAPAPGIIDHLSLPTGPGLRVDTGVAQDDPIPVEFDSMIAKLVAHGRTREEALSRLSRALRSLGIVIRGGTSNRAFLIDLLAHPDVRQNNVDIGWLERCWRPTLPAARPSAAQALVATAVETYQRENEAELRLFLSSAGRGRPEVRSDLGRTVDLGLGGQSYAVQVHCGGPDRYLVTVDDHTAEVTYRRQNRYERRLVCGEISHHVVISAQGSGHRVEVDGVAHVVSSGDTGVVRAPAPGVVLSVTVSPGQTIRAGERVAVMEAMKMETAVSAPFAGRVHKVLVRAGVQAASGAPLLTIEPDQDAEADAGQDMRVDFDVLDGADRRGDVGDAGVDLEQAGRFMLGYEIPAEVLASITRRPTGETNDGAGRGHAEPAGGGDTEQEADDQRRRDALQEKILAVFVDIVALFDRQVGRDHDHGRSHHEELLTYLRALDSEGDGLSPEFRRCLGQALAHYHGDDDLRRTPELERALLRIFRAYSTVEQKVPLVLRVLEDRAERTRTGATSPGASRAFRDLLDRLIKTCDHRFSVVSELARGVLYRCFQRPGLLRAQEKTRELVSLRLDDLQHSPSAAQRRRQIDGLVAIPRSINQFLLQHSVVVPPRQHLALLEVVLRRLYHAERVELAPTTTASGWAFARAEFVPGQSGRRLATINGLCARDTLGRTLNELHQILADELSDQEGDRERPDVQIDNLLVDWPEQDDDGQVAAALLAALEQVPLHSVTRRVGFSLVRGEQRRLVGHFTFVADGQCFREVAAYRGIHPAEADRLELWRMQDFDLTQVPCEEDGAYVFHGVARENRHDQRLFGFAEVHDITPDWSADGRTCRILELERLCTHIMHEFRGHLARLPGRNHPEWNRICLYLRPPTVPGSQELRALLSSFFDWLAPFARNLGLEKIVVFAPEAGGPGKGEITQAHQFAFKNGRLVRSRHTSPPSKPFHTLTPYLQRCLKLARRGLTYPYELVQMLAPHDSEPNALFPRGRFVEYDLDDLGRLVPVQRPYGDNRANVVLGVVENFTLKHPEGMRRVIVLGDPSRGLGALAEPECRRIVLALDLAEAEGVPLEWFTVSSGAKISMESGTENLDWTARVLRRLVEFTQAGGEVNVVVDAVNVGAQSYWNAEATMLMHTRGALIMTGNGSMVLTGKQALEYSGGVSAEDNLGIGGVERIMGPNGQAQYKASDLTEACRILLRYYEHTYVAPGERFPRPAFSRDPLDRDICLSAAKNGQPEDQQTPFETVGQVFSDATNPGRKKPFSIRPVMKAVVDRDHKPLERWAGMHEAETAVVWDAHLGGTPVCLVGIESRPVVRLGQVPGDGPESWSGGTLYPLSSKKVARAINAASGNRPLAILANLSGFDGSPESMRRLQLEYGAEIGRAVVNFDGPMVFCVISRYHGGAYVVFSRTLNDNLEVAALHGSYASVIGGAPAAAVVFPKEVSRRTRADERVKRARGRLEQAQNGHRIALSREVVELYEQVRAEKLTELAEEFDGIHCVQRAREVGSIQTLLPPEKLRPYLIEAVERGMKRRSGRSGGGDGETVEKSGLSLGAGEDLYTSGIWDLEELRRGGLKV